MCLCLKRSMLGTQATEVLLVLQGSAPSLSSLGRLPEFPLSSWPGTCSFNASGVGWALKKCSPLLPRPQYFSYGIHCAYTELVFSTPFSPALPPLPPLPYGKQDHSSYMENYSWDAHPWSWSRDRHRDWHLILRKQNHMDQSLGPSLTWEGWDRNQGH